MLDVQDNPQVWNFGNLWEPADISKCYYKMREPFIFSLATLAKDRKENAKNEPIKEDIPVVHSPEAPQIPEFSLALLTKKLRG